MNDGRMTVGAFSETFEPLRNRNLRLYLSGQAVSLIGTWMQNAAQAWVVWDLTKSEAALGTVGMLGTLPLLLLGPISGVWADRYDRRKILIYTQTTAMILAFILAADVTLGTVRLWHVYLLAAILGCVGSLDMPSAQAFIGDLAGTGLVRKAVVLNGMIVQISRILGPTLAGQAVQHFGAATAFWVNGLSFIAVIASLVAVKAHQQHRGAEAGGGGFLEGLRYMVSQPRILDLMIFTGSITFFAFSNAQILPAFADKTLHGGAGLYGNIMAASGVGALVSVLFLVPWAQRVKRIGVAILGAVGVAGLFIALFSLTRIPWLAMAAYCVAGMPNPMVLTTNNGLLQVMAPAPMRARLLTIYLMFSFGLQPIANLWVGYMAQHLGAPTAILINGLSLILVSLLMTARKGLLQWEPTAGRPAGGPGPQTPVRLQAGENAGPSPRRQ